MSMGTHRVSDVTVRLHNFTLLYFKVENIIFLGSQRDDISLFTPQQVNKQSNKKRCNSCKDRLLPVKSVRKVSAPKLGGTWASNLKEGKHAYALCICGLDLLQGKWCTEQVLTHQKVTPLCTDPRHTHTHTFFHELYRVVFMSASNTSSQAIAHPFLRWEDTHTLLSIVLISVLLFIRETAGGEASLVAWRGAGGAPARHPIVERCRGELLHSCLAHLCTAIYHEQH